MSSGIRFSCESTITRGVKVFESGKLPGNSLVLEGSKGVLASVILVVSKAIAVTFP
jgi:hypothetical protein